MKKWLLGLLLIPIILIAIVIYLVATESGLSFVTSQVQRWQPAGVNIQSSSGRVLGPLSISGFTQQSDQSNISVDSIELDWQAPGFKDRVLRVQSAKITGVSVKLNPSDKEEEPVPPTEPFSLKEQLDLPIGVELDSLHVGDMQIQLSPDAEPIVVNSIDSRFLYDQSENLEFELQVDSPILKLDTAVKAETKEQYPLEATATWSIEQPDLASVNGTTQINGNSSSITIDNTIATPYGVHANLVIDNPLESLSLDGTVTIETDALSSIKADLPEIDINGDVRVNGPVDKITAGANVAINGLLETAVKIQTDLNMDGQLLNLRSLAINVEEHLALLEADGTVDLSGQSPLLDINASWQDAQWPLADEPLMTSVAGDVKVTGTPEDLEATINASVGGDGALEARASYTNPSFIVDVNWTELSWPLDGSQIKNTNGKLRLFGTPDDYTLLTDTTTTHAQAGPLQLKVASEGSTEHINVPLLEGQALEGTFKGSANLNWADALIGKVSLLANGLNPGVVASEMPGKLAIDLDVNIDEENEVPTLSLNKLDVSGLLKDLPLQLSAKGSGRGDGELLIEQFNFETADTKLNADGVLGKSSSLDWQINSPDLASIVPDATGSIVGGGTVTGSLPLPIVNGNIRVRKLAYTDLKVEAVDLDANVDPSPGGDINVQLNVNSASAPGIALSQVDFDLAGTTQKHTIAFEARTDQGDVDVQIDGGLVESVWNATFNNLILAPKDFAAWSLTKPVEATISADETTVEQACLASSDATVCLDATRTPELFTVDYDLSELPISYVESFIPDTTRLAGIINSEGRAQIPTGADPDVELKLSLNNLNVDVLGPEDDFVRILTTQQSTIDAILNKDGLNASARLDLGQQGRMDAKFTVGGPVDSLATGAIDGSLIGSIENIDFLTELAPELESISGRLDSDMQFSGTADRPVISGGIEFREGDLKLLTPGTHIRNITASVKARNDMVVQLQMQADSGEGELLVSGEANLDPENLAVSLNLSGDQFQVVDSLDTRASISPNIDLKFQNDGLQFSGRVDIPVLEITPNEIPAGVLAASSDQVIVTNKPVEEKIAAPFDIDGTITVALGDQVLIDAFGLKAKMSGAINVKESSGSETTATGTLNIDEGTFKAYGQNLKVQKGNIIYAGGPIAEPGFDLEAVRNVTSELSVGVRARGVVTDPTFSLFSTPPMTESEQLSYLVLGRSLQNNSPSENSAVRQAAMALGVAGGKLLTEKFGDKLGVDSIAIDSELRETGEQAALVVGKYLTPKLFVSYGIGLFEPVSTLKLNYSVNSVIKLISETTESRSGGDVVFTFESSD